MKGKDVDMDPGFRFESVRVGHDVGDKVRLCLTYANRRSAHHNNCEMSPQLGRPIHHL